MVIARMIPNLGALRQLPPEREDNLDPEPALRTFLTDAVAGRARAGRDDTARRLSPVLGRVHQRPPARPGSEVARAADLLHARAGHAASSSSARKPQHVQPGVVQRTLTCVKSWASSWCSHPAHSVWSGVLLSSPPRREVRYVATEVGPGLARASGGPCDGPITPEDCSANPHAAQIAQCGNVCRIVTATWWQLRHRYVMELTAGPPRHPAPSTSTRVSRSDPRRTRRTRCAWTPRCVVRASPGARRSEGRSPGRLEEQDVGRAHVAPVRVVDQPQRPQRADILLKPTRKDGLAGTSRELASR